MTEYQVEVEHVSVTHEVLDTTVSTVEVQQGLPVELTISSAGAAGPAGPVGPEGAASTVPGPAMPVDYEGTGFPEGVVTADIGKTYRDNAGTNGAWLWIKATGAGNTGWKVVHGDTGWRNINTLLGVNWASGNLLVRRVRDELWVMAADLKFSANSSPNAALPAGFNPSSTPGNHGGVFYAIGGGNVSGVFIRVDVQGNGITFNTVTSATWLRDEKRYAIGDTTPWPATLPGTAA